MFDSTLREQFVPCSKIEKICETSDYIGVEEVTVHIGSHRCPAYNDRCRGVDMIGSRIRKAYLKGFIIRRLDVVKVLNND